jgi:glycerol-3-phosphate dehydrogenase (NAD(P)+)
MRCAVIGAGAWGTALADLLARNGHDVRLWAREPDVVESINAGHENRRFLDGATLAESLRATGDMAEALAGAPELITYAAPSHVLRGVVGQGRAYAAGAPVVAVATKGIEQDTLAVMTDVAREELPMARVVALSGPSFAAEVAARQPTAVVAASDDEGAALVAQDAFSGDYFRVYTHDDVIGVELGGSLKNVMAVATGIAEGLGLGHNSRAALITRGLAEISRLGGVLGAQPATFAGLAGLGDLVLTCTGGLSRNRSVGIEIGRGATLDAVMSGRETVAEGVTTARSALALARRAGVEMPIVAAVCKVLFEDFPARRAIAELMGRELRAERD